jgi:hypothetical protein
MDDDGRLDSWKEIATYLGRDVRTVRRWEKERALPVHRLPGSGRRAVFAYRSEIDEWLRGEGKEAEPVSAAVSGRAGNTGQAEVTNPAADGAQGRLDWVRRRGRILALLAAVGVLVIFALALHGHVRSAPLDHSEHAAAASKASAVNVSAFPWKPEVLSVQFNGTPGNLGMDVNGLDFGRVPIPLPFTGDLAWFRIGDVSCYALRPGTCEAGYTRDTSHLTYLSWSGTRIAFSHFKLAAPGDAIELAVWNPLAKNRRQAAAVWGGNVPPVLRGTPQISSVTFTGHGKHLHITIQGKNFGAAPPGVPGVGNTGFLEIGDYAYHLPEVHLSTFFRAGYQNRSVICGITLLYRSWSDRKIRIDGFGGAYGQDGLVVHDGDPVSIDLWNTKNHLATAWGGRIP